MKSIPLTKGFSAIVDDDDYERVAGYRWYAAIGRSTQYAVRRIPRQGPGWRQTKVHMHRLILRCPDGLVVDHIDGDGLNNRRSNLRLATPTQNKWNCRGRSASGYRGVTLHRQTGKWMAQIECNGEHHYLGLFATPEAAAIRWNTAAKELFGEFAHPNRITPR